MDYQKKAIENLNKIQDLLQDYKSQLNQSDIDLQTKIKQLPNGPEKEEMNQYRNELMKALRNKDKAAVEAVIKQVQNR